ncbi:MAG: NAD(P)/FAD-dependent oxidoreductase [Cyclobacteriaceae bacterium]
MNTVLNDSYPVIIIGASIAGCTAACLYANRGVKVLLLDKTSSLENYKTHCTHFVQPCGSPVLRKVGVYEDIDRLGMKSKARFWTSAGWIESKTDSYSNNEYAINLERSRFDPYIKKKVKDHPLIDISLNSKVEKTDYDATSGEYSVGFNRGSEHITKKARLVVAADGRHSTVAGILKNEATVYPNERFVYFGYYKNLPHYDRKFSDFWVLGKHMAFIYPLLDNHSLIALFIHESEKQKWKRDLQNSFTELVASLPDGPDISVAEPAGPIRGMSDIRSFHRSPLHATTPFIGDAVLSLDPAAGTGCSFALLSADWLVEHTTEALHDREELLNGLEQYASQHTDFMSPHIKGITADSRVTKDINVDKKFYATVIESDELKEAFFDLGGRLISPKDFQKLFIKNAFAHS